MVFNMWNHRNKCLSSETNWEFPSTGLLLCHSPHVPNKKLQGRMVGDLEALLRCCLNFITLTVEMNQLLLYAEETLLILEKEKIKHGFIKSSKSL